MMSSLLPRIAPGFLILGLALPATERGPGGDANAAAPPETHVVEMVFQDGDYRFVPADITAKPGDRITFVVRSGGPHNVAFDAAKIPDDVEPKLSAALPDPMAPLSGPLLVEPGAEYTIALDDIPPGTYPFHCLPHLAMGMTGTITVSE